MVDYHKSWQTFMTDEKIEELTRILEEIGEFTNPPKERVLLFLEQDLNNIKCVIMGQDPYFQTFIDPSGKESSIATGRAFEVNGLNSWLDTFNNNSLKNIVRLIYKTYNSELILFSAIREKIKENSFSIAAPNELFKLLEKQGVLLFNRYLSCERYKPNSHRKIWEGWSDELIEYISANNEGIDWFLWGKEAQKVEAYIQKGKIYKSNHPRLNNKIKEEDFLNSNCFKATKNKINWCGR